MEVLDTFEGDMMTGNGQNTEICSSNYSNPPTVIWTGRTRSYLGGQGNKNTWLILLNHRFQRAFSFAAFIQVSCFHMNQPISMSQLLH